MTINESFFRLNFPNLTLWAQIVIEKYLLQKVLRIHIYKWSYDALMIIHLCGNIEQTNAKHTHIHTHSILNHSNLYRNSNFMRPLYDIRCIFGHGCCCCCSCCYHRRRRFYPFIYLIWRKYVTPKKRKFYMRLKYGLAFDKTFSTF